MRKKKKKTCVLHVRVDEDTKEKLDRKCFLLETQTSTYIRKLIRDSVKENIGIDYNEY